MRPSLERMVSAAAVCTAAAAAVSGFSAQPASAIHLRAGAVEIVNPSGGAPLSSGNSNTDFRFKLPTGSACTGDSANAGYRIQSYLVPQSVNLDTLKFDSSGPVPVAGQFRAPMYDTSTVPYVDQQTASSIPAGGPGGIIQPLPAFNFAVYDTAAFPFTPGVYNVGIACTLGPPGSPTQLDKYWNTVMTITANAADPGPAKISWVLGPLASGPTFAPLSPARVWDSRVGPGPMGRIGAAGTRDVMVTGLGGVPATGVTAVVLNVTAVAPSAGTYVTAWPTGEARPNASNLNIPAGDTRPNLVTVKVGAGGQVSFYNDAGTIDLIADVAGWYGPSGGQRYTGVSPARVWDTRVGPGPTGRIGTAGTRDVTVTGLGGVPATGVTAVILNVTAVAPSAGTYATAWPTGEARPNASNLNIPAGDTRPNLVVVKVGAGGQVSFYNDAGTIDLIADVAGYFGATGASLNSVSPARVWDSRVGPGPVGRIGAAGTRDVTVTGLGGVPATGVTAVILNVTAVAPSAGTYVTAWPTGEARPNASNLNIPAGDTRANLVVVKVGAGGQVSFYNDAGTIDLIADVAGWYGSPGA